MALRLRVKKTLLKRKVEGVMQEGYYGRVITNGTKTFEDILKASTHGSTLDYREAELACKMLIDGIADSIKQGYIVDLGVLGKLHIVPVLLQKSFDDFHFAVGRESEMLDSTGFLLLH